MTRYVQKGLVVVAAGILLMAAGVLTARRGHAFTNIVFLTISASDSQGGRYPVGTKFVHTATVTNSSETTFNNATPTFTIGYQTSAMSFLSNAPGWSCTSANVGQEVCVGGTLTLGSSTTADLTYTATGFPAQQADVTYMVTDGNAVNFGTISSSDTVTHSGSLDNAASYTKDVPAGAFGRKVGVDKVVLDATTSEIFTFTDGPRIIKLFVPAEAIQFGSHIALYRGDQPYWSSSMASKNKDFVDGYAVAWTWSGSSTGTPAASSVTLVVSDTGVKNGDTLYRATTSGIGPPAGRVGNGAWTVSFTEDPGFVAGRASAVTATNSVTTTSTATTPGLPAAGRALASGQASMPLVVAGILLVVAGSVAIGLRRRSN